MLSTSNRIFGGFLRNSYFTRNLSSYFSGNEVAIVTGASSGIGAGTALKLAEKGVNKFCLTGRNVKALKETKSVCIDQSNGKLTNEDILLVNG